MKNLPALNSRKVIKALKKAGFTEDRQKGSHLILINPNTNRRTVKKPLLKSIIEDDAGLTIEEFLREA
ncbi:MAG: type II toxin-antitoxin system HicA family toxin [Candidatus Blackburnbacteria bacterium]|nr:type II toxin-antitoxin system HicA family toxin [Candidatus Blackburnbacteria bacterium]